MELLRNLYQIQEQTSNTFTIKLASKDHPIFKAHFPNNEVLPGFIQIDIVSNILKHNIYRILKAKFMSIIKPDETILYNIHKISENKFRITIKGSDNKKVSEVIYEAK